MSHLLLSGCSCAGEYIRDRAEVNAAVLQNRCFREPRWPAIVERMRTLAPLVAFLLLAAPALAEDLAPVFDRTWFRDEWAGRTYTFARTATGSAVAREVVFGSGVPVVSDKEVPVAVADARLTVDGKTYVYDAAADVLLDEDTCGNRLVPARDPLRYEHTIAPVLEKRGLRPEDALGSTSSLLRREAIFALAIERRVDSRKRLREVLPLLEDEDPEVRAMACWAAGVCHETRAKAALEKNAAHAHPIVRREAARALDFLRRS